MKRGAYGKLGTDTPKTVGARIKRIRMAWGWSQRDLAGALNIKQQIVSHWEREVAKPSGAALSALATVFGVERELLMDGENFTIPPIPEAFVPDAPQPISPESLRQLLPTPTPGLGWLTDLQSADTTEFGPEELTKALLTSISAGRRVWLVVD